MKRTTTRTPPKTTTRTTTTAIAALTIAALTVAALTVVLLVAGGCAEKRLVGTRVDVEGFESAQRTKASSSNIVLPAPESSQDWRQEQSSALHTPPRPAQAFAWQKLFTVATGKGRSRSQPLQAIPIVAESHLFALSLGGDISAFDAATGRQTWRYRLHPPSKKSFGGGLAFADGRVFVSTGLGVLAALDAQTGALLWQQQLPFPLRSAPTIASRTPRSDSSGDKSQLLVVTPTYRTYAFNLDGEELWQQQATGDASAQLTLAPSPGAVGRYAVVGYSDGSVVAIDTQNGRVLWEASITAHRRNDGLADIADITTPPVIASGLVYASSFSGRTVALDLASGALRWAVPLATTSTLVLYGTTIFVVDQNSLLSALDANNGKVLWERQLTARFGRKQGKPVLWNGPLLAGDQLILAGSNGEIVAVDAREGSLVRRMRFTARFTATPIAAQGRVFFLDSRGNIHAFE